MVDLISKDNKGRIASIDFFKILAMILVIWGHALQYGIDKVTWYPHPAGHFLASFHMPLFMFLSGLFAHSALKRPFHTMLWQKIIYLLLPTIVWTSIEAVLLFILNPTYFDNNSLWYNYITEYWFIKSLLGCYIIYFITNKVFRNNIVAALVGVGITWAFPIFNQYNISSMIPFFYIGGIMRSWVMQKKNKTDFIIFIISSILFAVSYYFWKFDYTFYELDCLPLSTEGGNISFDIYNLGISLYRLVNGFLGTIAFISLFKLLYSMISNTKVGSILSDWGQDTFGIYMIHLMILVAMAKVYKFSADTNIYMFNYVYVFISILLALLLSMLFIKIVLRMPSIFRILLIGKK